MSFLLDTNVVSELRHRRRANPAVAAWAEEQEPGNLYLSVMTMMELEIGILRLTRRDTTRANALRRWLEHAVKPLFLGRIIPIDVDIATRCAQFHVPRTRPERDALIAATALTRGLALVTRNVADFEPLGVSIVNPFADP